MLIFMHEYDFLLVWTNQLCELSQCENIMLWKLLYSCRTSLGILLLWLYSDPDPRGAAGPEDWRALGVWDWDSDDRGPHSLHSAGSQHQCLVASGSESPRRILWGEHCLTRVVLGARWIGRRVVEGVSIIPLLSTSCLVQCITVCAGSDISGHAFHLGQMGPTPWEESSCHHYICRPPHWDSALLPSLRSAGSIWIWWRVAFYLLCVW